MDERLEGNLAALLEERERLWATVEELSHRLVHHVGLGWGALPTDKVFLTNEKYPEATAVLVDARNRAAWRKLHEPLGSTFPGDAHALAIKAALAQTEGGKEQENG